MTRNPQEGGRCHRDMQHWPTISNEERMSASPVFEKPCEEGMFQRNRPFCASGRISVPRLNHMDGPTSLLLIWYTVRCVAIGTELE